MEALLSVENEVIVVKSDILDIETALINTNIINIINLGNQSI